MAEVDAEDLEYHITFPSPLSPEIRNDDDEEEVVEEDSTSSEPVVILLGWAGCEDKHLVKYSSIYDKSCITIRYTAPTSTMFFKQNSIRGIAVKLLDLLEELSLLENPIFIHVFSNGGGFVYRYMAELIHTEDAYKHLQLKGVIFDSCPSQRKLHIAAKAFMKTLPYHWAINFMLGFLLYLYLLCRCMILVIPSALGLYDDKSLSENYWNALLNDPSPCPQLYLYSTADEIVSHLGVEEHMKHRMKKGIKVHSVCWEDSPHVQHFRHHREPYIQNCLQFVGSCLGRSPPNN